MPPDAALTTDTARFPGQERFDNRLPSAALTRVVSTIVTIHFVLIGLSYFSTVAASTIQNRMLDAFRPYLAIMHFDADGMPLCFTTSDRSEKTHLLQQATQTRTQTDDDWNKIDDPGLVGGDRQRRWQRYLASIAELGNNEQTALAAWLVEPLAIANPDVKVIRIVRQPDLVTTVVDDAATPPYTAAIVREQNGSIRLLQLPPPRLAAESVDARVVDARVSGGDRE